MPAANRASVKPKEIVDAARTASLPDLRRVIKAGGDVNAKWRGYRPLHALMQERAHGETKPSKERLEALDLLLANGADPEQLGAWPPARAILIAAFTGVKPFVERLVKAGARVDRFASCALGDIAAVRRELKHDPELALRRDNGGLTPLQCAAASRLGCFVELAALLLDAGADPNARTKSWSHEVDVAYFAASAHHMPIFTLLLDRGADATAALPSALWNGTLEMAEAALQHGAKIDRAVSGGKPLINDLVRWGRVEQTLWLLERGASPSLKDDRGWTAIDQAESRGNERMLEALRAKK
jgi:ankyrin repeat protein